MANGRTVAWLEGITSSSQGMPPGGTRRSGENPLRRTASGIRGSTRTSASTAMRRTARSVAAAGAFQKRRIPSGQRAWAVTPSTTSRPSTVSVRRPVPRGLPGPNAGSGRPTRGRGSPDATRAASHPRDTRASRVQPAAVSSPTVAARRQEARAPMRSRGLSMERAACHARVDGFGRTGVRLATARCRGGSFARQPSTGMPRRRTPRDHPNPLHTPSGRHAPGAAGTRVHDLEPAVGRDG
jgi:hypothetical protein